MNPILIYAAGLALLGGLLAVIVWTIWNRLRQSQSGTGAADCQAVPAKQAADGSRVAEPALAQDGTAPLAAARARRLISWPKRGARAGQPRADTSEINDVPPPPQRNRRLRTLSELDHTGEALPGSVQPFDYAALEVRLAALFEDYLANQTTLPAYIAAVREEQAVISALLADRANQRLAGDADDLDRAKSAVDWCLGWAAEQAKVAPREAA